MKISINTNIINGKFTNNKESIIKAIKEFEGENVIISIQKKITKRSNNQNSYLWGCIYPLLKKGFFDTWGEVYTVDQIHSGMKNRFNYVEKINEKTGDAVKIPKSTTKNNTAEQEEYHQQLRNFALEWFNINIPLPNEKIFINS